MKDEIRNWIANEGLTQTTPGDDDKLRELGMDSVGFLLMFDWLTERWGVTVADDEMNPQHVGTVALIAALVERKLPA
jgi:acyl carrier protein